MVRKEGLEPSWIAPPAPKAGASANSATFALLLVNLSPCRWTFESNPAYPPHGRSTLSERPCQGSKENGNEANRNRSPRSHILRLNCDAIRRPATTVAANSRRRLRRAGCGDSLPHRERYEKPQPLLPAHQGPAARNRIRNRVHRPPPPRSHSLHARRVRRRSDLDSQGFSEMHTGFYAEKMALILLDAFTQYRKTAHNSRPALPRAPLQAIAPHNPSRGRSWPRNPLTACRPASPNRSLAALRQKLQTPHPDTDESQPASIASNSSPSPPPKACTRRCQISPALADPLPTAIRSQPQSPASQCDPGQIATPETRAPLARPPANASGEAADHTSAHIPPAAQVLCETPPQA